jgi:glycosyltransferase involved in cell wall biosynthesis
MNGQRDTWQNMLIKNWIEGLTPEKIDRNARMSGLRPDQFLSDPYTKVMSAGSDEHMGVYSGQTGVYLHIPNLENELQTRSKAELAKEALLEGRTSLFGGHHDSEKMTVAFIDYLCQIGINIKDPGLLRIALHKGETKDKLLAMVIANGFLEVKRHRYTSSFMKVFHNCFLGDSPGLAKKILVPKHYKPVFNEANRIAGLMTYKGQDRALQYKQSIESMFESLFDLLVARLKKKIAELPKNAGESFNIEKAITSTDLPAYFRDLFSSDNSGKNTKKKKRSFSFGKFLDGLSFPSLASTVIIAATFTSAKVLYNTRPLLEAFSMEIGKFKHPKRMLWMTDTFEDKNGVAVVLRSILKEITRRNLPIDMMVCSDTLKPEPHLVVVRPKAVFTLPFYRHQPIRIPNILQVHQLFKDNEYDRIMCSTEGIMGLASLFLKQAYSVPAYFYIHTDWITFSKKVLNLGKPARNRIRRILRAFYRSFDHLFVLNTEQERWLLSNKMAIDSRLVHLTAHWVEEGYAPRVVTKEEVFGIDNSSPVLLFTGRISEEKGATEIPEIFTRVSKTIPNIRMVFAGTGPAEEKLKKELPDAVFLGWVDHHKLPEIYSAADLMILPSQFDTFGCVVLESMSCGTPVAAYKTKGPKDIIQHERSGFLAGSKREITEQIITFFENSELVETMSNNALSRAKDYNAVMIMDRLLEDIDLSPESIEANRQAEAITS